MLGHCRVTPSIKFAGTHLYTGVERGTVGVKCLAKEHNAKSLVNSLNSRSEDELTNHEATTPPTETPPTETGGCKEILLGIFS